MRRAPLFCLVMFSAHAHLVIKLLMFIIEEIALKMSVFHSCFSSSIFTEQLIWE